MECVPYSDILTSDLSAVARSSFAAFAEFKLSEPEKESQQVATPSCSSQSKDLHHPGTERFHSPTCNTGTRQINKFADGTTWNKTPARLAAAFQEKCGLTSKACKKPSQFPPVSKVYPGLPSFMLCHRVREESTPHKRAHHSDRRHVLLIEIPKVHFGCHGRIVRVKRISSNPP